MTSVESYLLVNGLIYDSDVNVNCVRSIDRPMQKHSDQNIIIKMKFFMLLFKPVSPTYLTDWLIELNSKKIKFALFYFNTSC